MIMKKMLIVSPFVPYDSVGHAGGKTHNFYLKYFKKSGDYEVRLISFYNESEKGKVDLDQYKIDHRLIYIDPSPQKKFVRKVNNFNSRVNPFNRYVNMVSLFEETKVLSTMHQMKREGYEPDIIILEWTQMVLLAPKMKKIYPNAKIAASEHDVTFLGFERKYRYENQSFKKKLAKFKYNKMKKLELDVLKNTCDLVVTHNGKDKELLLQHGMQEEKLHVIVPYFMDMTYVDRKPVTKDIIFFGAMGRAENYLSAIWFIENVFPKIADKEVRFIVIGGGPHKSLFKYVSDRVAIAGFVEDVTPYFASCLCAAVPLLLGAGIKVKILEMMSAGIPTLTNDIGIEGIPAIDGVHYLHCVEPEEYVEAINKLVSGSIDVDRLSDNMRSFMKEKFNLEKSAENYLERVNKIVSAERP